MSNSGGYAVTRTQGSDRFYTPPAVRRNRQLMLQQQQQIRRPLQSQRPLRSETRLDSAEADTRTDSDESTLSIPNSAYSSSPSTAVHLTNLERLIESVTPHVDARFLSEPVIPELERKNRIEFMDFIRSLLSPRTRGLKNREADIHPYFCLGDLWETFKERSFYGVEVSMLFDESNSVKQFFVPSLSGIQLYIDPHKRRILAGDDVESSREPSSAGSSDCEAEKRARGVNDGAWIQNNLANLTSQRIGNLKLSDRPPLSSSSDETEVSSLTGQLLFEYFEFEQPHLRPPLSDKISSLAAKFPNLQSYRSCDLLPASWLCVAWYPIYRVPVGPTLQSMDARFLTFHSLSTHPKSQVPSPLHGSSSRKFHGVDPCLKISLPVFGLAFDKLRGSVMTPNDASEWHHVNSLLQAADNWLRKLQVRHPDYQFFVSQNSRG